MKIFNKVPFNKDLSKYVIEFDNGKRMSLEDVIKEYINAEPEFWFTTKTGVHIPVMEGETRKEATEKFFKEKDKKGLDKMGKRDYNISRGKQRFSRYASDRDEKDVTPEKIVSRLKNVKNYKGEYLSNSQIKKIIEDTKNKLDAIKKDSADTFRIGEGRRNKAKYNPERLEVHRRILADIFGNKASKKPAKGEKPSFIFLGGRGGSGKSKFNKQVYDNEKFVLLDADYIKGKLPGYEGWNAAYFHEESADILEKALETAKKLGLNVVLDATMNGLESSKRRLQQFIDAGYRTEAHYLYVPRQESAQRVITRFLEKEKGRYVPIDKILQMTKNEENFDEIKEMVDAWSFSDNNVPKGEPPRLIDKKGDFSYKKGGPVW